MSSVSGLSTHVQPVFHAARPTVKETPGKEGDKGPGASDLRHAPAPLPTGSVNLVV